MPPPLLQVDKLRIAFGASVVVDEVSFALPPGRIAALVGESGSGKSLTARALLGLLPQNPAPQVSGTITWQTPGEHLRLDTLHEREWTAVRGRRIGLVLQEPMSSLNPTMRVAAQLREVPTAEPLDDQALLQALEAVGLPDGRRILRSYPHQLSGGQLQRVAIAMALLGRPELLIADEPTTALDADVQTAIIQLLLRLRDTLGIAILFISHDLRLVRRLADEVWVMRAGRIVEQQAAAALFARPQHPYTRSLLADFESLPKAPQASVTPLLRGDNLSKSFVTARSFWGTPRTTLPVFKDISLRVNEGEVVGLMGDSGSGKTTLGRCLLGLEAFDAGTLTWRGEPLPTGTHRAVSARLAMQVIFQNPYAALTPRMTVGQLLEEPLRAHAIVPAGQVREEALALLTAVGLPETYLLRYANQLSGGERQRVCIARALSVRPQLIVCDECLSALDRKVQGDILALLLRLRAERGLAYLFISHDAHTVRRIADRVYRLADGRLTEEQAPGGLHDPHDHAEQ